MPQRLVTVRMQSRSARTFRIHGWTEFDLVLLRVRFMIASGTSELTSVSQSATIARVVRFNLGSSRVPMPISAPYGRFDWRQNERKFGQYFVVITAYCRAVDDMVTIEMTAEEWAALPPVQYAANLLLSRQQPRRPGITSDPDSATRVPRGHIEWKDGQNWVTVTALGDAGQGVITVEITLAEWFSFMPVQTAVEDRLSQKRSSKFTSIFKDALENHQSAYNR
jgi:hypothetical protein